MNEKHLLLYNSLRYWQCYITVEITYFIDCSSSYIKI